MRYIILDTETEAWSALRTDRIPALAALGWTVLDSGVVQHTIDVAWAKELARAWNDDPATVIVGHNLSFDTAVLGIRPGAAKWWCTMLADILCRLDKDDCWADQGSPRFHSLGEVSGVKLEGKESTRTSFIPGRPLTEEQLEYLRADVRATQLAYKHTQDVPGGLNEVDRQARAHWALEQLTRQGVEIDKSAAAVLRGRYLAIRREQAAVLKEAGWWEDERVGKRGGHYAAKCKMGPFRAYVEEQQKARGIAGKRTPKKILAVDKDALLDLLDDPKIKAWVDYHDVEKLIGTFLDPWIQEQTAVIHPRFHPLMRTGRTSCSRPNLQQVPSRGWRSEVKQVFVPGAGRVFYELDYGQLELCCLAYVTQGQMLKLINEGRDLHRALGMVYFRKDKPEEVTKEERQLMKCASFGLPGGMGIKRFRSFIRANGLPDPGKEEATRLRDAWLSLFPEMDVWLREQRERWAKVWSGKEEPPMRCLSAGGKTVWEFDPEPWEEANARLSRRLYVPSHVRAAVAKCRGCQDVEIWLLNRRVVVDRGRARCPVSYTEYRNTRFQGLAANLTKQALTDVMTAGREAVRVHMFIHDSLLISVPETAHDEEVDAVAYQMLGAAACWLPGVRVTVEVSGPGENWLAAKKGETRLIVNEISQKD